MALKTTAPKFGVYTTKTALLSNEFVKYESQYTIWDMGILRHRLEMSLARPHTFIYCGAMFPESPKSSV